MKCFNNIHGCSTKCSDPWPHYEVNNFFTSEYIDKLYSVMEQLEYTGYGEKNRYEFKYSHTHYKKYDLVKDFIDQFRSHDGIGILKQISPIDLNGKLLRISLLKDTPGYTIGVHTDATYKLFTGMVYLPVVKNKSMGTRFYDEHKREIKARPYVKNTGFFFFSKPWASPCVPLGSQSAQWHGFNKPFNDLRMSFMINIFDAGKFLHKMREKNIASPHCEVFTI